MAKFNFDEKVDRRGTFSYKWDSLSDPELLPLWVADMDFKVAPEIAEAVQKRASHDVYGYGIIPDDYYEAYINWYTGEIKSLENWKNFLPSHENFENFCN